MEIRFSRRTDLALLALRVLGERDTHRMSRTALAHRIDTTPSFLTQVMAPLVRACWVISERGPGGGYQLAASAFRIQLLDVIEATEMPASDGRCVLRDGPCPGVEACPVHVVWNEARSVLVNGLGKVPAVQVPPEEQ